jgi:hypothetical protein
MVTRGPRRTRREGSVRGWGTATPRRKERGEESRAETIAVGAAWWRPARPATRGALGGGPAGAGGWPALSSPWRAHAWDDLAGLAPHQWDGRRRNVAWKSRFVSSSMLHDWRDWGALERPMWWMRGCMRRLQDSPTLCSHDRLPAIIRPPLVMHIRGSESLK